ncbi:plasmid recombination protein [Leisingera sp. SS27]|uniref:plasmid recombination protein n=1 Tax=Leisingera sp. SS27 TaxID=2979462 RepID=UPI0023305A7F|nr:plasmid recombination protein [Leisingera sp. SS27]MDC0657409.1 plasmid recombination protein [Leisingera sp. SS27]
MRRVPYSCVRVQKIRTAADARNATRHGRRARRSFGKSAIDLDRTHLNCHWSFDPDTQDLESVEECPDYREALEIRRDQLRAKRAKNGAFGTEVMFTASPSLFLTAGGAIDLDQAKAWAEACLGLAQKRWPGMCVAARLDLDETTPHLSVFIIPVYEKSYSGKKRQTKRAPRRAVSHNKVFGGPDDLSRLQRWAADGLQTRGFDVQRGRPVQVTRARHFRPDGDIYKRLTAVWRQIKKREDDLRARETMINSWMQEVVKEIWPLSELVSGRLKAQIGYLKKFLSGPEKSPPAAPKSQTKRSGKGLEPTVPTPKL